MKEPILSLGCVNPTSLVRAVNGSVSLLKHPFPFIRPVGAAATHGKLPTMFHSTRRAEYPVPSITLINFRSLRRMVHASTVKDYHRTAYCTCSVSTELADGQHRIEVRPAVSPGIDEIASAIVVPQRARVYHSLPRHHTDGFRPGTLSCARPHHHHSTVGITPIYQKPAIVMTNGRCPHALAMLWTQAVWKLTVKGMPHYFPVNQVTRVENWQSWHTVERTGRQIIVFSHCTEVGITIVGIENGVCVGSVPIVRTPDFRTILPPQKHGKHRH